MTRPDMKKRVCWQTLRTSPLFAAFFPNSITIVKTSNAKQSRPTTTATLLGNKILFSVGDSIIITSVYCAVWDHLLPMIFQLLHFYANYALFAWSIVKKANNLTACWSERDHGRREREGLVTLSCSLQLPCPSCPTLATTKSCADHCNCHYCYWPLLPLLHLRTTKSCWPLLMLLLLLTTN